MFWIPDEGAQRQVEQALRD